MPHAAHIPLSPGGPSGGSAARDPVHANPPAEVYALLSSRPEGLAPEEAKGRLARFEFGVPRTIARVKNPKNAWMFTPEMGVDVALNQADLLGHLIVEEMSMEDMMTLLKLRRGQFSLVEEKVHPRAAAGKTVGELRLPPECVPVAVLRKGAMLLPRPGLVFHPADEVFAVVHATEADRLTALLGPEGGK